MSAAELNRIYLSFTFVCSKPQMWHIPVDVLQRTTQKRSEVRAARAGCLFLLTRPIQLFTSAVVAAIDTKSAL